MISLKNLHYLATLHQTNHFTKAAKKCFVTVSTLSCGIANLEHTLNTTLIERNNRNVVFTPLGNQVAAQANKILEEVKVLKHMTQVNFFQTNITLGIIPTISPYILPQFLTLLTQKYPNLGVVCKEYTSSKLVEQILESGIDFAIFAFPYDLPESIAHTIVFADPIYFIHHKHRQKEKILTHSILLPEEGHCLRNHILKHNQIESNYISDSAFNNLNSVIPLVNLDKGMSFIPQMAIQSGILQGYDKVKIDYVFKASSRDIGVIFRKTHPFKAQILELTALLSVIHSDAL